eukprot:1553451-Pleurochrysis_carterae.AAC.2
MRRCHPSGKSVRRKGEMRVGIDLQASHASVRSRAEEMDEKVPPAEDPPAAPRLLRTTARARELVLSRRFARESWFH